MNKLKKKEILLFLKNQKIDIVIFFVIFIISIIPVIFTWNRLAIGGDILIPFNFDSLEKYLYQWLDIQNGQYFSINYYPLYIFYKFAEYIGLNIYQISSSLLFVLNFIAGLGIYKLAKIFYHNKKTILYVVPVTFYLLSPALLNGGHYLYIYSFIPWFYYIIFKVIINNNIKISDVIWFNVLLFFSSLDLPNPKYIFHLYLISLIVVGLGIFFKLINLKFLFKNLGKIIILFLLSAYLFLPLGYFASRYSPEQYGVHIKTGYKDVGKMMDYGVETLDKMVRLHNDYIYVNGLDKESYNNNILIILFSYSFLIIIIWNLFFIERRKSHDKRDYYYQLILFILVLVYLFFATGSNPPFGFIYEYAVSRFSLLAFLRTTGGAVYYLSPLYAILLFGVIKNINRHRQIAIFCLLISVVITGYPLLNGAYYKNFNNVNQFTDRNQYGYKIPDEYFNIKDSIDTKKINAKILFPQSKISYLNTDWGYFGPFIYQFIYNSYNLGYNNILSNIYNHNVGFVFIDNSSFDGKRGYINEGAEIIRENFLDFLILKRDSFLPHIYIPRTIYFAKPDIEELSRIVSQKEYNVRSAIYSNNFLERGESLNINNVETAVIQTDAIVEFKKINPTKYRVIIHNASGNFPLIFSESFHNKWNIYLVKHKKNYVYFSNDDYKIFDGNQTDQASSQELRNYINFGYISSLGNLNQRVIKHKKWSDNREIFDYNEKYVIDFVSKNYQGSIQNDNLRDGSIYETWRLKPIVNNFNHKMVNGFANSWNINSAEICAHNSECLKNQDGTYDLEFVIEFGPQKIFYISILVSGVTLFSCLCYLGYFLLKKYKNK